MQIDPTPPRIEDDEPTTQEALPGVELGSDDETEQRNSKVLGPDAVDALDGQQSDEP
jgi:hypothetical protein